MSAALAALPAGANAETVQGRCTAFTLAGNDAASVCNGEELLFTDSNMGSQSPPGLLYVVYRYGPPGGSSMVKLHVQRIDADANDFRLRVQGVEHSAWQLPSGPGFDRQSPAKGQCLVELAAAAAPQVACDVEASDAAIGRLQWRFSIDDAASRRTQLNDKVPTAQRLANSLRQYRFQLAAAAQEGRQGQSMARASTLPASGQQAVNEASCSTEEEGQRAEAMVTAGRPEGERIAAACFGRAAQYAGAERTRLAGRAFALFERAAARGDSAALVGHAHALQVLLPGRWDATMNTWVDAPAPEIEAQMARARALFAQAAERGNVEGQSALCGQHVHGAAMAQQAAAAPQLRAQLAAQGIGTLEREAALALAWCKKAVDRNDTRSMTMLASLHARGLGVPKDLQRSYALVWKAAELGDQPTLLDLARAYEAGADDSPVGPLKRDVPKAIAYYRKGGREDMANALQAKLGRIAGDVDATVYGIALGFPVRAIGSCQVADGDKQSLCLDADVGAFARALDALGLGREAFRDNGLRLLAVKVNDQKMDTSFLFGLLGQSTTIDVAVDRSNVVHYISVSTRITAYDQVMNALTGKFGQPARTLNSEWKDPRTGAVVRRTPIQVWSPKGLQVIFHAQSAGTLLASETPMGRIDLFTTQFQTILQQQAAAAAAARPAQGKF